MGHSGLKVGAPVANDETRLLESEREVIAFGKHASTHDREGASCPLVLLGLSLFFLSSSRCTVSAS